MITIAMIRPAGSLEPMARTTSNRPSSRGPAPGRPAQRREVRIEAGKPEGLEQCSRRDRRKQGRRRWSTPPPSSSWPPRRNDQGRPARPRPAPPNSTSPRPKNTLNSADGRVFRSRVSSRIQRTASMPRKPESTPPVGAALLAPDHVAEQEGGGDPRQGRMADRVADQRLPEERLSHHAGSIPEARAHRTMTVLWAKGGSSDETSGISLPITRDGSRGGGSRRPSPPGAPVPRAGLRRPAAVPPP